MAHLSLRGILNSTSMTVLNLVAGIGLVALAAGLLLAYVPDGDRDLRAYESADRCPSAPQKPADCRWTAEFTVSDVRLTHKKSESDSALLTDADGDTWETSYAKRGPVLGGLDKGDQVTGTVWRGRLTEISTGDASQRTQAAPADMRTRILIATLMFGPTGVLMTLVCAWRLLRRRSAPEATQGMVSALGLAFSLVLAGLFTPLLASGGGENFSTILAVWLPIAALMTIATCAYTAVKKRMTSPRPAPLS